MIDHGSAQWIDHATLEILPWELENLFKKQRQQVPQVAVVLLW
jgi:hypothetical protein